MYEAHKNKMRLAIFGLTMPLFFHATLDFLNTSAAYQIYKYEHLTFANAVTLLFGYVLPVACQFSSLIFGFIRNKNDKTKIRKAPSGGETALGASTYDNQDEG